MGRIVLPTRNLFNDAELTSSQTDGRIQSCQIGIIGEIVKGYQPTPFGLRMRPELKVWLAAQATKNFRSLNAEIVHRLEQDREKENAPTAATVEAL